MVLKAQKTPLHERSITLATDAVQEYARLCREEVTATRAEIEKQVGTIDASVSQWDSAVAQLKTMYL